MKIYKIRVDLMWVLFLCSLYSQHTRADEYVKIIQQDLAAMECGPGIIDGVWGRDTTAAVKRFVSAEDPNYDQSNYHPIYSPELFPTMRRINTLRPLGFNCKHGFTSTENASSDKKVPKKPNGDGNINSVKSASSQGMDSKPNNDKDLIKSISTELAKQNSQACRTISNLIGKGMDDSSEAMVQATVDPSCTNFSRAEKISTTLVAVANKAKHIPNCDVQDELSAIQYVQVQMKKTKDLACGNTSLSAADVGQLPSFYTDTLRQIEENNRRIEGLIAKEKRAKKRLTQYSANSQPSSNTTSSSNSSSSQRKTAPNVESCITFKRHLDVGYWSPAKHAINTCSYPVNFGSCVEDAPAGSPDRCQNYGKRYGGFGSGNRIKPGESKPVLGTVVHDHSQNKNHKYYNKVKFGVCPLGSKGGYMEPNKDTGRYTCVLY